MHDHIVCLLPKPYKPNQVGPFVSRLAHITSVQSAKALFLNTLAKRVNAWPIDTLMIHMGFVAAKATCFSTELGCCL